MNKAYYIKRLILYYLKYNLTKDEKKKLVIAYNIAGLINFIKESEFEVINIPQYLYRLGDNSHFTFEEMENYQRECTKVILDLMQEYEDFTKLNGEIEDVLNDDLYKQDLSNNIDLETAKNLASDFFYYYDKDLYEYYNYLRGKGLIIGPGSGEELEILGGSTLFILDDKKNPYFVSNEKNLVTAVSIVHETMHSYLISKVLKRLNYDDLSNYLVNDIDEVGPLLMEILFLKYLSETGIYKQDVETMKYQNIDFYLGNFLEVKGLLKDIKEDYNDDQKKEYFEFIERNGLSYLYAFIFYKKYLENGDKSHIYSFYKDAITMDKKDLFKKYDLSFNSLQDISIIKSHAK